MDMEKLASRLEVLRKAGKSVEADKIEKKLEGLLEEANMTPARLIIEIDMGLPFVRDFTKDGFHLEKPRQIGKKKFEVRPILKDGESPISGDEMLKRAKKAGCTTSQEEGDQIATFLNSPKGQKDSKAIRDGGGRYIILPNEDGLWVHDSSVYRDVPVLNLNGEQWVSDLHYLGDDYGSRDRFLVPCKP